MTDRTQTRDNAYRWGMLMWFNQLLLDQGTITEAEFRQMRLKIEDSAKQAKDRRCCEAEDSISTAFFALEPIVKKKIITLKRDKTRFKMG